MVHVQHISHFHGSRARMECLISFYRSLVTLGVCRWSTVQGYRQIPLEWVCHRYFRETLKAMFLDVFGDGMSKSNWTSNIPPSDGSGEWVHLAATFQSFPNLQIWLVLSILVFNDWICLHLQWSTSLNPAMKDHQPHLWDSLRGIFFEMGWVPITPPRPAHRMWALARQLNKAAVAGSDSGLWFGGWYDFYPGSIHVLLQNVAKNWPMFRSCRLEGWSVFWRIWMNLVWSWVLGEPISYCWVNSPMISHYGGFCTRMSHCIPIVSCC